MGKARLRSLRRLALHGYRCGGTFVLRVQHPLFCRFLALWCLLALLFLSADKRAFYRFSVLWLALLLVLHDAGIVPQEFVNEQERFQRRIAERDTHHMQRVLDGLWA